MHFKFILNYSLLINMMINILLDFWLNTYYYYGIYKVFGIIIYVLLRNFEDYIVSL